MQEKGFVFKLNLINYQAGFNIGINVNRVSQERGVLQEGANTSLSTCRNIQSVPNAVDYSPIKATFEYISMSVTHALLERNTA